MKILRSAPMLRLVQIPRVKNCFQIQVEVARGMWQTAHEYPRANKIGADSMFEYSENKMKGG